MKRALLWVIASLIAAFWFAVGHIDHNTPFWIPFAFSLMFEVSAIIIVLAIVDVIRAATE